MKKKFYITTAIPYVNAKPHIGHALEFLQTDVIARYHKLLGYDVCTLSGGDENALKNVQAAENAGLAIKEFIDNNTKLFLTLAQKLNIYFDVFQKGSDQKHHFVSSQKLWDLCQQNGDIYKKTYQGLYCVGCESFFNKEELNDAGECPEHPGKKLDIVEEENYFFSLSKYQNTLIDLISKEKLKIIPSKRKNEVLAFLKNRLEDISISRSNTRAKNWGVPVPNDPTQRIYVWFDALNIYQTGVGFGWNNEQYNKWWPADVHVVGKGITRFHAIYWPAFLISAGLKIPKSIFVHEYLTVNGQKMSKTIGNVVDPLDYIEKFGGPDPLRYYLLAKISPFADGDFSESAFISSYNSDLANGLGNLIARVAAMSKDIIFEQFHSRNLNINKIDAFRNFAGNYEFDKCLEIIWNRIKKCDIYINENQIWKENTDNKQQHLRFLVKEIREIAYSLSVFLPETSEKILHQFGGNSIESQKPMFPRIQQ